MTKKNQQTLWLVGGLLGAGALVYYLTRKPGMTAAEIAAAKQKHDQAVAQGDFATAAKLAADIANSPLGGAAAGGLSSLFSSSSAGPGADQPPMNGGYGADQPPL